MRDKKRIKPFLTEIERQWKKAPDLRFGQLIVNVFGTCTKDPFFYEDNEMAELFKSFFKEEENE